MAKYNEMNELAQKFIDKAITAAVNACIHRERKEYKQMNRYLGEKDAYIHAAAIADNAENPQYGETYGIYCERFIEKHSLSLFEKAA